MPAGGAGAEVAGEVSAAYFFLFYFLPGSWKTPLLTETGIYPYNGGHHSCCHPTFLGRVHMVVFRHEIEAGSASNSVPVPLDFPTYSFEWELHGSILKA